MMFLFFLRAFAAEFTQSESVGRETGFLTFNEVSDLIRGFQ
jgi:hypothetical protein